MFTSFSQLANAHRNGENAGITSVCSAHPLVVRAALRRGKRHGQIVLIEATCNQVNQYGGYTGMTPADFVVFVEAIAREEGFDRDRLIFGGDHLGPNPWRKLPAEEALAKAEIMVADYVSAGFTKIHLDASMGCAGEPAALDDTVTAQRAARLAKAAEKAAVTSGFALPSYIIGTEVPVPGGADHALTEVTPTSPDAARQTIAVHRERFASEGLQDAFDRVIGIVVQPGVEFGNENVVEYRPEQAVVLSQLLNSEPQFVFEAHSTDYQTVPALAALVRDGFPILKVGPGLTFALREALYGLDLIAGELDPAYGMRSLAGTMERLMLEKPDHWASHYHGSDNDRHVQRHYSYSDRIRYYWTEPEATEAVNKLTIALSGHAIPETLLRQFLPNLAIGPADRNNPEAILIAAIDQVLADYSAACGW
ncbi:D-tagatose-bisphosphate aldolase, class II, non-catalytic subunit [Phyllobacterium sp. 628]|uniref:D-tagatose-bisphosphate aldolase, class II, non-catalytic subunit n=1 Tax=Phyllobacterium sp. 628 TaxID=2718938 RepID=UPI0016625F39|nr:D-tagatose-bisphosphate aldolase, class II, non-catalytic subunit [Phyllobacterium sp. 628]QND51299.1 D-tagatose-bisphosphate aldolase, class II, non-catalytic subunit [Phyllobacterium sp. 628]